MPVLVTAAHLPLARRLVTRLLAEGGEVRAYSSEAVADLRAAGAVVAAGTWDDEGHLEAALTDVHTIVHVGTDLLASDPPRLVDEAAVVATAAANAGVRRLIAVTLVGADPASAEPLRRAAGEIERLVASASPPSIAVRPSLVDTPAVRDALATAGLDAPARAVEVAPVRVDDLVELIVAFDRARSRAAEGHLVVSADGPVRMTVDAYLGRLGLRSPGRGDLVGRRLLGEPQGALLREVLTGGPWWTDDPVVVDGWAFAELAPRPIGP